MSSSKGVVYKPYDSELDDAKVILFDEHLIKNETRQKCCAFSLNQKSVVIFFLGIVTFLILLLITFFVVAHESPKECLFRNFVVSDETNKSSSCLPLQSVRRIVIVFSQDSNNLCSDHFTCNFLFHERVKYSHYKNLRYNFVVSSDYRFLLEVGYDCSSSVHRTIDFTVTFIENNSLNNNTHSNLIFHEDALRILQIIYEGFKCNENQLTFPMISLCVDGCNLSICENIFEDEIMRLKILVPDKPSFTFESSIHETNSTLQENLKWLVCEDPVKDIVTSHPKKKSWENSARNYCIPYEPVDHISIEVVEVHDHLYCLENVTCTSFSNIVEKEHDGFNNNFIVGSHETLYVGGGFHCKTINSYQNSLRIKVLRNVKHTSAVTIFHEIRRIAEVIKHGLACGKILKNYSISDNCSFNRCFPQYEFIGHNTLSILSAGFRENKHYDNGMGSNSKVVLYEEKWISSCHHTENLPPTVKMESIDVKNKSFLPQFDVNTTTVHPVSDLEETATVKANDDNIDHFYDSYEDYEYY